MNGISWPLRLTMALALAKALLSTKIIRSEYDNLEHLNINLFSKVTPKKIKVINE